MIKIFLLLTTHYYDIHNMETVSLFSVGFQTIKLIYDCYLFHALWDLFSQFVTVRYFSIIFALYETRFPYITPHLYQQLNWFILIVFIKQAWFMWVIYRNSSELIHFNWANHMPLSIWQACLIPNHGATQQSTNDMHNVSRMLICHPYWLISFVCLL